MDRNQAYVDPAAIDEAAKTLEMFAMRMRDFDTRLDGQLNRLGISFRGPDYDRLCAAFQTTRKLITKFTDETAVVLPKLREDSNKIRAAQNLKPNA